jgi:hypothetical protein
LHCAGIEPATSGLVGEYSHHYATPAVKYTALRAFLVSRVFSHARGFGPHT